MVKWTGNKENKEKKTISFQKANIFSFLILIIISILLGIPYFLKWGLSSIQLHNFGPDKSIIFIIALIMGIFLHEGIHGIFWLLSNQIVFSSLSFGIKWQYLAPYIHCSEPMKVKIYRLGIIAPAIILGLIPAFWGLVTGNFWIFIFGSIFTMSAAGDFLSLIMLKNYNGEKLVQDHPDELGFFIINNKRGEHSAANS